MCVLVTSTIQTTPLHARLVHCARIYMRVRYDLGVMRAHFWIITVARRRTNRAFIYIDNRCVHLFLYSQVEVLVTITDRWRPSMWCVLDTAPADLHAPPAGRLHAMHGVDLQAEAIIEPGPDGAMISSTRSGLQVMGRRVCCLGKQDWLPEKLSERIVTQRRG